VILQSSPAFNSVHPRHTSPAMPNSSNVVSIHPYFKVHAGKLETVLALLPAFVAKTQGEKKCLWYDFTLDGDTVHCREAYAGAEGAIEHLDNVAALLGEMLTHADLARLELHGPAAELEKLRPRCAALNPAWFAYQCGIAR
jgi:quinol monooxygenase YgiN